MFNAFYTMKVWIGAPFSKPTWYRISNLISIIFENG